MNVRDGSIEARLLALLKNQRRAAEKWTVQKLLAHTSA
jgi:hypothetical protein